MTDSSPDDNELELTDEEWLALEAVSSAVTTAACCPSCRQVRAFCAACGWLNALKVPPKAELPIAIHGCCPRCRTPALITVSGWANDAAGDNHPGLSFDIAHLERCLKSGIGRRPAPQRQAIPPAVQLQLRQRLRGPAADNDRWRWRNFAQWQRDEPFLGTALLPSPAAAAASYRRLTAIGPVVVNPGPVATYSLVEFLAVLLEMQVPLPPALIERFKPALKTTLTWLAAQLQPYRGNTP